LKYVIVLSFSYVIAGRQIAQLGMQSLTVVKVAEIVDYIAYGFFVLGIISPPTPFHCQVQKETAQ
jgi:hypothetical protein